MNYKLENTMKRNIIYLAGIALCAIGLFSGCDEDLPSYANLTVNAETLTINLVITKLCLKFGTKI